VLHAVAVVAHDDVVEGPVTVQLCKPKMLLRFILVNAAGT
jgi:hypothetical protein